MSIPTRPTDRNSYTFWEFTAFSYIIGSGVLGDKIRRCVAAIAYEKHHTTGRGAVWPALAAFHGKDKIM